MKSIISILGKAESVIRKMKNKLIYSSNPQAKELDNWYKDDPHGLKRSDFDFLTPDSIVFDLGGYEGQWTSDIYSRFNCNVFVFEPVSIYADLIKKRFEKNDKIKVFAIGLGEADSEAMITIDRFSSRLTNITESSKAKETIQLRSFTGFIHKHGITQIDLIKINIEGAEFGLLEYLLQHNAIKDINCLLIQFHDFAHDAVNRRSKIQAAFTKTHNKVFDYPFVWECWRRK